MTLSCCWSVTSYVCLYPTKAYEAPYKYNWLDLMTSRPLLIVWWRSIWSLLGTRTQNHILLFLPDSFEKLLRIRHNCVCTIGNLTFGFHRQEAQDGKTSQNSQFSPSSWIVFPSVEVWGAWFFDTIDVLTTYRGPWWDMASLMLGLVFMFL